MKRVFDDGQINARQIGADPQIERVTKLSFGQEKKETALLWSVCRYQTAAIYLLPNNESI